jgi:macrolide-specific efflux system membrane fusion protein
MKNKKIRIFFSVVVILILSGFFIISKLNHKKSSNDTIKEISPVLGSIQTVISTTGTVLPKNRLEIKPTVNGRIDKILVQEGDKVKTGDILAWMSSTERAALIDAAQEQGAEALKYWQEVYKPISLLSPIDGEVIVATTQPGQTVTTTDDVVVLSDQLIVRAQVDETDIGKIKLGQSAVISLDAYPNTKIKAKVDHIYYESKTVNNVTIYEVDLIAEEVPAFFRSGMNATVDFTQKSKENTLLLPVDAAHKDKTGDYVLVKQDNAKEPIRTSVKLGISDDKNVEVLSGISENDRIIVKVKKYSLPKNTTGTNPFMPARR